MTSSVPPGGRVERGSRWPVVVRIVLVIIAALLIAAHFLRAMDTPMVALSLAAPLLLLWRRRWSLIALQVLAYLAAWRWIDTALGLIAMREQLGRPWTAAAIILGAVALFTALIGVLLNGRSMRERYPR
ncbi:MAG: hypothetical protein K0B16_08180 [Burkholderiaceae bacterium]|nr:hypothetical protein [Burkholderiaceae bacterium]